MDKQCVVVTGSIRGLGLALARAFLIADCAVLVSGRDENAVNECVDRLRSVYPTANLQGNAADVARFEDV